MPGADLPLFVWGLMADAEVCRRLFGGAVDAEDAVLHDYALRTEGGRFFVVPCKGAGVAGKALALTRQQLMVADAWVAARQGVAGKGYERKMVRVIHRKHVTAPMWVHEIQGVEGADISPRNLVIADRAGLLGEIDQFVKAYTQPQESP